MNIRVWIGILALFLATPSFAITIPGGVTPSTTEYLVYDVYDTNTAGRNFFGTLFFDDFRLDSGGSDVSSYLFAWTFTYNGVTRDNTTHPTPHNNNQFNVVSRTSGTHQSSYICVTLSGGCQPNENSRESTGYTDGFAPTLAEQFWFQSPTDGTNGPVVTPMTVSGPDVQVIPVPAAVWLFGSGLLGLVGIARRKKTA